MCGVSGQRLARPWWRFVPWVGSCSCSPAPRPVTAPLFTHGFHRLQTDTDGHVRSFHSLPIPPGLPTSTTPRHYTPPSHRDTSSPADPVRPSTFPHRIHTTLTPPHSQCPTSTHHRDMCTTILRFYSDRLRPARNSDGQKDQMYSARHGERLGKPPDVCDSGNHMTCAHESQLDSNLDDNRSICDSHEEVARALPHSSFHG